VLVIIGFIVAGILVGRDMIRQAQFRSLIRDVEQYKTAFYTFQTKYQCLPGDCPNATNFFGASPSCAYNDAGTGTQTCNGDGDGVISDNGRSGETAYFWQQLGSAGLINGILFGLDKHFKSGESSPCSFYPGRTLAYVRRLYRKHRTGIFSMVSGDVGTRVLSRHRPYWWGTEDSFSAAEVLPAGHEI
jgi:hypothetical protein